jgi:FKBP-type peptidyl-prolyl cis-trans isomerase
MQLKFSSLALIVLLGFGLGSCIKETDADLEIKKAEENEKAIQAYIAEKKVTAEPIGDGVHYEKVTLPSGTIQLAAAGDLCSMHYVLYTLDGRAVDSTSRLNNKPFMFPRGYTDASIFQIAAARMSAGEVSNFYAPFYYGYGNKEVNGVPAYSPIRVKISLDKILTETQQCDEYMKQKGFSDTQTFTSGLRLAYVSKAPKGALVSPGQTVTLKYTGNLLFYTTLANKDSKPNYTFDTGQFAFKLGAGTVVKGFDEGVSKLRVGEKAVITFPSALGYGDSGSQRSDGTYAILPKAPISFEVEILSVAN